MQHPNARLTPRGRFELVQLVEAGATLRRAAAACNVATSTAWVWVQRWRAASPAERTSLACLRDRSSRPRRARVALRRARAAGLRGSTRDRLGAAAGRRRGPACRIRRLEGAAPPRLSRGPRARASRPTATSGPAPATCCTWTSPATRASAARPRRHRRSHATRADDAAHASATTTPTRSSTTTRGWPTSSSTATSRATVTGFVERALAFFAEPRHHRAAADDRQRLRLHQEPLAAAAARRPRHPAPDHRALPAAHKRQGRALPPDHGPRMGLRPRLPLQRPTAPHALPHWLSHYNEQRPHSSLGNRPPISRVRNL